MVAYPPITVSMRIMRYGVWGRQRPDRHYDFVVAGTNRWMLCVGWGAYDPRRRILTYMGKEEGLALMAAWGFPADVIWHLDDFWLPKTGSTLRNSLRNQEREAATTLLSRRRALVPKGG